MRKISFIELVGWAAVSRTAVSMGTAVSLLVGCGGGSAGSGVAPETAVTSLTLEDKTSICEAQYDYWLGTVIGSAESWCQWDAQTDATGTTDAELQSSCAVAYDLCMANAQANFDAVKGAMSCQTAEPLSATLLYDYRNCNTTAGKLEQCGFEQFDTAGVIRGVPCAQYTVARRMAANTKLASETCDAIAPTCPVP
jgi:hypothetical protein